MKRERDEQEALSGVLCGKFLFKLSDPNIAFAAKSLSDDDYVVRFKDYLPRGTVALHVYFEDKHIFGRTIALERGTRLLLNQQEGLIYELFESYQVQLAPSSDSHVAGVYLKLEDNNVGKQDICLYQPQVDMKSVFLNSVFATTDANRVVFLKWFPPDIDPNMYGIKLDPREVPQRCPLWFKLRGEVSGSKAYVLVGYFADRKDQPLNAFAKSAMRLGTLSEDLILISYLHAYPKRIYYEVGWVPIEHKKSWGASPDGIIVDPDMSWDKLPSDIASNWKRDGGIDITHGACEFKTSRTKLGMEAYFYPQLYMEMIALNVVWADLIRCRPERVYDQITKEWTYKDVAHVYRIYRHKPTEDLLMNLWARSQANMSKLKEIIQEEAYVRIRMYFDKLAAELEPVRVIEMTPETQHVYSQYYAYKHQHAQPEPFVESTPLKKAAIPELDLQQLANRGIVLSQMNKTTHTQQMINVTTLQLEGYTQLLKSLLNLK